MESLDAYIPMDRRHALAQGIVIPDRVQGVALFADISGFTPLTEALVRDLGSQRGAEELTHHLNQVYDALITELHHYGGSVIGFSGDAITCWIAGDTGLRATACALAMQQAMECCASVSLPSGAKVSLAMKVAVATGATRRFVVGDPELYVIDVLAGTTLDRLAAAEHRAQKGEVVLDPITAKALGDQVRVDQWRQDDVTSGSYGVVGDVTVPVDASPWGSISNGAYGADDLRPWLLPPVYERLHAGRGQFLAELRPAVVLFLRFGGIDYDDDERAREKLDAYIRWIQSVLVSYEGYVLGLTIGDKGSYLYTAFGAPIAHEDDAVRAVSAALELQALPPQLDFIQEVQIGISQGRVLAGAYGGTQRRIYGVIGDDVNLAARLMQAAPPAHILVSHPVRQAAEEAFTWQDSSTIKVKGKAEPVAVHSPVSAVRRRAIRVHESDYALPMVGRETELALIKEKLDRVLQGYGQLVGVTGHAGIGKTRLVAEAVRRANDRQLVGYGGECESYGTNTSYLVWRAIWRAFFGLEASMEMADQVNVLQRQLERVDPALVPRLPLLGAVLNLPIPDNDLTRAFDAELRKASLEALLVDCVRARAEQDPLLFVLEDCHWLDSLSHDLLEVIGRAVADLPVLLLLAYRPPEADRLRAPRVSRLPYFTQIELTDFTPQEAEQLITLKLSRFFGSQTLVSPELIERITARAEGNPFYIEELLNYLRDQGLSPHHAEALGRLDLPTSLHSLILSRLDQRTESQKITLRVASVVGRLFEAASLWGMYPELGTPERVKADLEALSRLDLTVADMPEPELTYLFRHIVTQEVAYESLPYATRAGLHEQLANYLEQIYSESLDQYIDLLAYHFERSENEDKKRDYLRRAGEAAQADYANEAAMNYYQRLLPLLSREERVPVMLKLGEVLQLVGEWNEAHELYRQALELAEQLDDQSARAWCQAAIAELLRKQGEYAEATTWFEQARQGFVALGDQAGIGQVFHSEGTLAAYQGDMEKARILYEKSLDIRRELDDRPHIAALLNNLGIIARRQGDYEKARVLYEESLSIAQRIDDKWLIATCLNNLGNLALQRGDDAEARTRLEVAVNLQREVGHRWYLANALTDLGNVARAQGDYAAARAMYEESLIINRALGDSWAIAHLLEDIGCLAALEGQAERALRLSSAAEGLREAIDAPLPPADREKLEQRLESARKALGDAVAVAIAAEGKAMSLEQAIDYAFRVN